MAVARGWVSPSVLPGFGLTLGFAGMFLAAIVLVPMAALVMKGASLPLPEFPTDLIPFIQRHVHFRRYVSPSIMNWSNWKRCSHKWWMCLRPMRKVGVLGEW